MKKELLDRFLRYVKINTQSRHDSSTFPSSKEQFDLAHRLQVELEELNLLNVRVDENCYVTALLKSNIPKGHALHGKVKSLGLVSHLDTSPDVSGKDVRPLVREYQGGDIELDYCNEKGNRICISMEENESLEKCMGHTLVTSDGSTLLGADDKAGIAAIMTALDILQKSSDLLHGDIYVCFTPDEEVGHGTKYFPFDHFPVYAAYTLDGGGCGVINKETFSADTAFVTFYGKDIHPGAAFGKMINASRVACDFVSSLPKNRSPEQTKGNEPYIHPCDIKGSVDKASVKLLLRDFDTDGLKEARVLLENLMAHAKDAYPGIEMEITVESSYRNMLERLSQHSEVLDTLYDAVKLTGLNPTWLPIRGGTDGAGLTEKGIPTPNIFIGGYNFHSRTEWLSIDILEKSVETILNLMCLWAKRSLSY